MRYFEYAHAAHEAGIPSETLSLWESHLRQDYPGDEMMVELRLLRACHAVLQGGATPDEVTRAIEADADSRPCVPTPGRT